MEYGTHYICSLCDDEQDFHTSRDIPEGKLIIERTLCFACAFWTHKIECPLEHRAIIDGRHHVVYPGTNYEQRWAGYGGSRFKVRYFDGRVIESNNVWHQGVIPDHFKSQLPDNAEFIYDTLKSTRIGENGGI